MQYADLIGLLGTWAENFTVFAPNNAAIKQAIGALYGLPEVKKKEAVGKVLLRHVLLKIVKTGHIELGNTDYETAGGEEITITKTATGDIKIRSSKGMANVIAADTIASNGVIHIVDNVF